MGWLHYIGFCGFCVTERDLESRNRQKIRKDQYCLLAVSWARVPWGELYKPQVDTTRRCCFAAANKRKTLATWRSIFLKFLSWLGGRHCISCWMTRILGLRDWSSFHWLSFLQAATNLHWRKAMQPHHRIWYPSGSYWIQAGILVLFARRAQPLLRMQSLLKWKMNRLQKPSCLESATAKTY